MKFIFLVDDGAKASKYDKEVIKGALAVNQDVKLSFVTHKMTPSTRK